MALPITTITPEQIIHILNTDQRIWKNGHSIQVAILSDMLGKDDQWVRWLGFSSAEPFMVRWIEANLIQDWPPPKRFPNPKALLKFVRHTPGAVGFTNIQPTSLPSHLRTIHIQEAGAGGGGS